MKKNIIVTKESLQLMLDNSNPTYVMNVIGRALIVLHNNQTMEEQASDTTVKSNGVGFTGADAYSGSKTAKYWMSHTILQTWMIEKWLKRNQSGYSRLAKYHSQLNEAATGGV